MKMLITSLVVLASLQATAAPSKYCKASKKTTQKIESVRFVELPFQIVQNQIVSALISDKCIRARLSDEEVLTLSGMLLSYEYNEDTAKQIIGEFLAQ
ncbi:hypothetical protein [Bdellovibrio bacteriovorus]|uniref:hypothetical protein n=1 Tax=Bdellovibrio TaxID=958 RepID=UPI0035A8D5F8